MYKGALPYFSFSSSAKDVASERWMNATFEPCLTNPSVRAAPIPEPPPVMNTDLPAKSLNFVSMRFLVSQFSLFQSKPSRGLNCCFNAATDRNPFTQCKLVCDAPS